MEHRQTVKNGEIACTKSGKSSFSSAMLCFLQGFSDRDEKNPSREQKTFRFRLLRKSRSSANFDTSTTAGAAMVVPNRTHNRTQSAVSPSLGDQAATTRAAVRTLAGSASAASLLQVHRSPMHQQGGVFTKMDKTSLKLLSTSSPAMTSQPLIPAPPSPKQEKREEDTPTVSKSRQKKFHRHFPSVESDEQVLNYYSCALISDILLQGHLYITKNYFAFYSNVFGYVTKLLIPMITVEKITKEKTARIIPNAVGISTAEEKHVFGSLISRENTYRYMIRVWEVSQRAMEEAAAEAEALVVPEALEMLASDSDSSETKEGESEKESCVSSQTTNIRLNDIKSVLDRCQQHHQANSNIKRSLFQKYRNISDMPTQSLILVAAIFLLVGLSLSATLILYRISKIHEEYVSLLEHHDPSLSNDNVYNQLLRFSIHLHSKSANSMHSFIDSNLHQIAKVRQNLELLSTLLMPKESLYDAKENHQEDSVDLPEDSAYHQKDLGYHQEDLVDDQDELVQDSS